MQLADRLLDLQAQTLRDAQGQPVPLRPQAFAVLEMLARHPGQLVTKERMLDAVWPGLVVTDGSLTQAISDVRSALGSDGRGLIRTVARRGYLLSVPGPPEPLPLRAAPPPLPAAPGPLFGRHRDLGELLELLAQHRLVTVIGAGGIGKTVLALAAARRAAERVQTMIGWVDLAPLTEPALLPGTIARALDLPLGPGADPLPALLRGSSTVEALVVLDNAEHLADAVAHLVRDLLDAAPGLRLLVTSQAALQIEAERLLRLAPLPVPQPDAPFDDAAQCAAVEVFVDRARSLDHRFALTPDNVASIGRLVRRLDGLPLAIRLAASRVHMLGLASLEMHLDDRLQWLEQASRDAPDRQRTLLGALQWSYGLLSAAEQRLFRLLGTFVGGFRFEMAQALLPTVPILAGLAGLVERSLVTLEAGDPPRYRLLESQRAFALSELERLGEAHAARHSHARAMAEVMAGAARAYWSTPDQAWLARWAVELDNVRAAMKWSERHDPVLCALLVGWAGGLFELHHLAHELRQQASVVDAGLVERGDPALAARYWLTRGYLVASVSAGDGFDFAARAESFARASGDILLLYLALCLQGISRHVPSERAPALLEAMQALEQPNWPPRLRVTRWMAAFAIHSMAARWREALAAAEQGFSLAVQAGALLPETLSGSGIIVALLNLDDGPAAEVRSREIAERMRRAPPSMTIAFAGTCALVAICNGDLPLARQRFATMIDLSRKLEWPHFDVFADVYPLLALDEGRYEAAARLLGFAEIAMRRAWPPMRSRRTLESARQQLEVELGAQRFAALRGEGAALVEREDVCALLLATLR